MLAPKQLVRSAMQQWLTLESVVETARQILTTAECNSISVTLQESAERVCCQDNLPLELIPIVHRLKYRTKCASCPRKSACPFRFIGTTGLVHA